MQEQNSLEKTEEILSAETLEKLLVDGDLSKLTAKERLLYYRKTCESLGLNPLTKPFGYIELNGKLTLYALKGATEQLRAIHGISVIEMQTKQLGEVYVVQVTVRNKEGRTDIATGVVSLVRKERDGSRTKLELDELANALMRGETKSKRRATLSICGLGWMDESEVETVPTATVNDSYLDELPKRLSEVSMPTAKPAAPTVTATTPAEAPPAAPAAPPATLPVTEATPTTPATTPAEAPPATSTPAPAKDDPIISPAQAKRLYAIWKSKGVVMKEEMQAFLLSRFNCTKADNLLKSQYEEACRYAETGVR